MQATDGSSSGARSALIAMSGDLKLPPIVLARALEYAFDNLSTFPNAGQAVGFGIIRQGHCVNIQILEFALQRLRLHFGGTSDSR